MNVFERHHYKKIFLYFVNYYYAGKTNFSFSSESQRNFELRDVLELFLVDSVTVSLFVFLYLI